MTSTWAAQATINLVALETRTRPTVARDLAGVHGTRLAGLFELHLNPHSLLPHPPFLLFNPHSLIKRPDTLFQNIRTLNNIKQPIPICINHLFDLPDCVCYSKHPRKDCRCGKYLLNTVNFIRCCHLYVQNVFLTTSKRDFRQPDPHNDRRRKSKHIPQNNPNFCLLRPRTSTFHKTSNLHCSPQPLHLLITFALRTAAPRPQFTILGSSNLSITVFSQPITWFLFSAPSASISPTLAMS